MTKTIIAVVLWFIVLTIGIRIDAASLPDGWAWLPVYILASTLTNVGLLAILASLVGDSDWQSSIVRGFTIYVMLISGAVVLFTESVADPTVTQYGKIAGTVSLVCVLSAYRPELFTGFLDRVAGIFVGNAD